MSDISDRISTLIDAAGPGHVWVPTDFATLGSRDAIDKTLQRMVARGDLRRIDRGLYDRPTLNTLTKRSSTPDYRAVVDALSRRDQTRLLVDGMTAANDLGLTDAVPARVTLYTDTRRRSVQLDKLLIDFKLAAPSRLYWAGRPAMRVVQALHWLKDMLPTERRPHPEDAGPDPERSQARRQPSAMISRRDSVSCPAWMQSLPADRPRLRSDAHRA